MTYNELKSLGLSLGQLKQLRRNVGMLIEDMAHNSIQELGIGSVVRINHKKCDPNDKYTILKINRKTVMLHRNGGAPGNRVKASMGLLEAV